MLVGRLVLWGLALGGEAGATLVLTLLAEELRQAIALVGARSPAKVGRGLIDGPPRGKWSGA